MMRNETVLSKDIKNTLSFKERTPVYTEEIANFASALLACQYDIN